MLGYCVNSVFIGHLYSETLKILGFLILCSLIFIIKQSNPVFSVFGFIMTALLVFFLLILVGAEFFALLILIIYTGVITVLFLFVVIMYNFRLVNFSLKKLLKDPAFYLVSGKILGVSNSCALSLVLVLKQHTQTVTFFSTIDVLHFIALFNTHYVVFLLCGLMIFIAMLGSIVITYPFYKHLY